MKPDSNLLLMEAQVVMSAIQMFGDTEISDYDKRKLSERLAILTESVRRKYGLISEFYFPAEIKAREQYNYLYGIEELE